MGSRLPSDIYAVFCSLGFVEPPCVQIFVTVHSTARRFMYNISGGDSDVLVRMFIIISGYYVGFQFMDSEYTTIVSMFI